MSLWSSQGRRPYGTVSLQAEVFDIMISCRQAVERHRRNMLVVEKRVRLGERRETLVDISR